MLPCLQKAVDNFGGTIGEFAAAINVNRTYLYEWDKVPQRYVLAIEKAQKKAFAAQKKALTDRRRRLVTRSDMRPDLYPKGA